jgi:hypothetical protein
MSQALCVVALYSIPLCDRQQTFTLSRTTKNVGVVVAMDGYLALWCNVQSRRVPAQLQSETLTVKIRSTDTT